MKALNIIATAYRATLEEQDDTVVWITHAMSNAGADLSVLLRGNAVNYVVKGQGASGLTIGDEEQTQPPRIDEDIGLLIEKGVEVYVLHEDLDERGIPQIDLIEGLTSLHMMELPTLFEQFDRVWHW